LDRRSRGAKADNPPTMTFQPSLRQQALNALALADVDAKLAATLALAADAAGSDIAADAILADPGSLPGRGSKPELVMPSALKPRPVNTAAGRAALLHALAHIELNAVNLALDIIWRFPGAPAAFYRNWVVVAREEAGHFKLLRDHLRAAGHDYGDLPAHDGLWTMAQRTRDDLLARLALVPRTLEARGLDASPAIRAKLASAGDLAGAAILDIILRDEIGHVAIGNRWYRWLCDQRGVEPVATAQRLAKEHGAPLQRGPFNLEARRAAGFDEVELAALALSAATGQQA
jgi:uncharacterized ferritin-like protein (DUF455 family)